MAGLTRALARFVADLDATGVPADAVHVVERGIADCVGVMFAGRDEPVVAHALSLAAVDAARGEARVLGDRGRAAAIDAALVNTVAAHVLDYDDTGLDGHPSAVLAPVVLAEGERLRADGRAAIAAYVAGYETWAELVWREPDKLHGKGWHPTPVYGTVAAAAAAANLARLDATATAHALGLSASMCAGLVANFGSMAKPFQVGFAARNGIVAARLAARGVSAASDALEHPRGLLAALSPASRVRLDDPLRAGTRWQILLEGLNVKRYPVCYAAHRVIDAALSLRERVAGRVDEIEAIDVEIGRLQAALLRFPDPRSALDAKFSAQFAVACALSEGGVGIAQLCDAQLAAPGLRALMAKVRVQPLQDVHPDDPLCSPFDRVTIVMRGGERIASEPVARAKGHAQRPLTDDELAAKFLDCAGPSLGDAAAQAWWRALSGFASGGFASLPGAVRAG